MPRSQADETNWQDQDGPASFRFLPGLMLLLRNLVDPDHHELSICSHEHLWAYPDRHKPSADTGAEIDAQHHGQDHCSPNGSSLQR